MFAQLQSIFAPRWLSVAAVFLTSLMAGELAADGMSLIQWLGALTAVLGSVCWAVLEHTWPNAEKAPARD